MLKLESGDSAVPPGVLSILILYKAFYSTTYTHKLLILLT